MIAQVDIVATQRELAIALNVSERMVRNYIRDGMPGFQGRYSIAECREWVANNINSPNAEVGDLKEKRLRAEIRKLNADAESKECKNAIMRGDILYRDDVDRQIAEVLTRIKTRLESVPDEMETTFPASTRAQNKADLDEKIRQIQMEIAAFELEASDA